MKTIESTVHSRTKHTCDASLVASPCVGQSRRAKFPVSGSAVKPNLKQRSEPFRPVMVPVIGSTGLPLMPCSIAKANIMIRKKEAKRYWLKGVFCVKLINRSTGITQPIVVGIDPGSKREAFTVQSSKHTYLNILSDAVTHVKDRVEVRRNMRRARRFRKTPCRKNKFNRNINLKRISPSTRSRWQIKLNILKFLKKLYPITDIVVEDIKAKTIKKAKKWNKSFSPLEVGKAWFYSKVSLLGKLILKQGYDTFNRRNDLKLKKTSQKMSETFNAHCVDSWVLASFITGKNIIDDINMLRIIPVQFCRRQLHRFQAGKYGKRPRYGGTMSGKFKRGSVVMHKKFGMVYIGGNMNNLLSLHDIISGKRLTQSAKCDDIKMLFINNWKTQFLPRLKPWVSLKVSS